MSKFLDLAKSVVAKASANGAEAEVIITRGTNTIIKVSGGEVEQLSQSGSQGMGVRVIKYGKTGYAYTSDFSDDGIDQTWRAAVELAEVATADDYRTLPDPQPIPDEDLKIWDDNLQNVSTEAKIDVIERVEKAALDYDPRVFMTNLCQYQDNVGYVHMANSKGFAGEYGSTFCVAFLFAIARDDKGMTNGTGFGAWVNFSDFDPEAVGSEAAMKAVNTLGGEKVPTQKGTIILDHFIGAQIIGALAQALTADAMQRKRSFLLDKIGQTVGNDMVTLMDNGRLPGGLATAPFDGEGVPTSATRLIDEGVLQNVIYDSYSAAKEGKQSTGNAQRNGHRSLPSLGPSNFYMQPGHLTREEIIKGVDKGLYVLSGMQTGGIDPVTGDCSMSASGLWIENGEVVKTVSDVTIATTLHDFLNNISQVGSDLRMVPIFGNIGLPTLRVDNVTIGG